MTKKMIYVDVGTPVLQEHNRYGSKWKGIDIRERECVYVEGDIESLYERIRDLRKQYGKQYTNLQLVSRNDCGCYHECSCSPSLYLHGQRLESDDEYNLRLEREAEQQRQKDARDLAEFQRLREKFDK